MTLPLPHGGLEAVFKRPLAQVHQHNRPGIFLFQVTKGSFGRMYNSIEIGCISSAEISKVGINDVGVSYARYSFLSTF